MESAYDVVVVGLGCHGSASLYHLAKRGTKVLGLEQYSVAHSKGSSHGESRIIRLAYHEHPAYVPLLKRAWDLWRELEAETGEELLCDTRCIEASPPDFRGGKNCFQHSLLSAEEHELAHEVLSGEEVNKRFPGYQLPAHYKALLGPGGILASEKCIKAHIQQAQRHGAEIRLEEAVESWHASEDGSITICTTRGRCRARQVIFANGSWMGQLVPELQAVLTVERQVIAWFEILDNSCCCKESFPVCVIEDDLGPFYAFPQFQEPGMKIGKFHHLHERVNPPESMDTHISHLDEQVLREGMEAWFPAATGKMLKAAPCMFTCTPDHNFIVDRHPLCKQVLLCSACSGHGFKFGSVLGEILADLTLNGETGHDIALHRISAERQGHVELLARFANANNAGRARL